MRTSRFLPLSSACCLILASCEKSKPPAAGAAVGETADDLAAERVLIEEERIELERERLADERAALEEEKAALLAERETRLAEREVEVEWQDLSIEERQHQLAEREAELGTREEDFALREASLSEQELELAGRDGLDDWEPEPLPELLEPVADYDTFYEDLQPYGSWYETPDYGYVYQPTVVVQDTTWRPYTRGRWACTNLGWNWISEEPFGWACFHYGRWALLDGRGWVWVPGDEWAPAWVCWREGSEHVGWAPLPPETLCDRGRGWDSSVEADFGIGALCFNFVARRHMADPLWRHCLPVARNSDFIQQTNNITNIRFHRDRIIAGGPAYERLRGEVGKPWPVYQIETDRFRAIRNLNQRNASVRGNRLAVFAPNLNTRWNDQLKPSQVAGRWDEVKVVRAESGIKPLWAERFREARVKRKETAAAPVELAAKVKQFEVNRLKVGEAQRKLDNQQRQLSEARREKQVLRRAVARDVERPAVADEKKERTVERAPTLAERQREAADRLRETRARRSGSAGIASVPATGRESPPTRMTRPGEDSGPAGGTPESTGPVREAVAGVREEVNPRRATTGGERRPQAPAIGEAPAATGVPRPEVMSDPAAADSARRARVEELRRQQQEQAAQNRGQARPDLERNPRSPRIEPPRRDVPAEPALRQEQATTEGEENTRRGQLEEARQQQLQAARERLEQARQQQAERQGNENAARLREVEEARARQEQSRRAAEDTSRGQQQAEMRQQQEQAARQQQEEMEQRQEQAARQQQAEMKQLQEQAARQQQEEMRRQQQVESARQQQEEMQRQQQQEEIRRQQQEQARQEQQERIREQQEEARRQSEERARQQQEERARQQEQARQQQEERARQQQEEQQRRQEERAREQSEQQEQQRQRGR